MVYCWLIDKKDTLNNLLIKEGCFPSGTMMLQKILEEKYPWEKELDDGSNEKSAVQVLIDQKIYARFIEQITAAELFARKEKRGIWK
ncbi:MAG: hypothetical protein ACRBFS_05725 [Aureispira sp.]